MNNLDCEVLVGDKSYKESEILEWKIKAEKYDALFSKENGSLYDTFIDKVIEESDKYKKERDEALKRCEELQKESKLKSATICVLLNTIEELEQDNKVLVDGVRALNISDDLETIMIGYGRDYSYLCSKIECEEKYTKIKSMLEVVEVEE